MRAIAWKAGMALSGIFVTPLSVTLTPSVSSHIFDSTRKSQQTPVRFESYLSLALTLFHTLPRHP